MRNGNYDDLPKAVKTRVRRVVDGLGKAKAEDAAARNFWESASDEDLIAFGQQAKIDEQSLAGDYASLSEAQKAKVRKAVAARGKQAAEGNEGM